MKKTGNREEVFNGLALHTSGKLKKEDLVRNNQGKIVSLKMSLAAKARYPALKAKLCAEPIKVLITPIVDIETSADHAKYVKDHIYHINQLDAYEVKFITRILESFKIPMYDVEYSSKVVNIKFNKNGITQKLIGDLVPENVIDNRPVVRFVKISQNKWIGYINNSVSNTEIKEAIDERGVDYVE